VAEAVRMLDLRQLVEAEGADVAEAEAKGLPRACGSSCLTKPWCRQLSGGFLNCHHQGSLLQLMPPHPYSLPLVEARVC